MLWLSCSQTQRLSQARAFQRRLAQLVKPLMVDGKSLNVATLAVALDKS